MQREVQSRIIIVLDRMLEYIYWTTFILNQRVIQLLKFTIVLMQVSTVGDKWKHFTQRNQVIIIKIGKLVLLNRVCSMSFQFTLFNTILYLNFEAINDRENFLMTELGGGRISTGGGGDSRVSSPAFFKIAGVTCSSKKNTRKIVYSNSNF